MKVTPRILLLISLTLTSTLSFAVTPMTDDRAVLEKDNTGRNANQIITAQTQMKGTAADVEVTRKLRERIMADNQLSTDAKNIKIITVGDAITLKGPVANRSEKVKIENFARSMAGKKKVFNRLTY